MFHDVSKSNGGNMCGNNDKYALSSDIFLKIYLRNSDIILNFSSHEKRRYGDQAYKIVPKKVNVAILFFKFINPTVQNSKL